MPTTREANDLRFWSPPGAALALAARVKIAGQEFVGDKREPYLFKDTTGEESPS
jgi:glucose-6-phosphate 1-dehydrogenase